MYGTLYQLQELDVAVAMVMDICATKPETGSYRDYFFFNI